MVEPEKDISDSQSGRSEDVERPDGNNFEKSSFGNVIGHAEETATGQAPAVGGITIPIQDGSELQKLDSKIQEKDKDSRDPFEHLPQHEADILRRQLDVPSVKVTFFTLFRSVNKKKLG